MHICIYLFKHLINYLFINVLCIFTFILYLFISAFNYLLIYLFIYVFLYLFIYLFMYLFIYFKFFFVIFVMYLFIYLFICVFKVCVHFGWVNAEHKFRVWVTKLGCMSRHFIYT